MKVEITIERLKGAKKSHPGRWVRHAQASFATMEEARKWGETQGVPREPTPGWAIRFALYP